MIRGLSTSLRYCILRGRGGQITIVMRISKKQLKVAAVAALSLGLGVGAGAGVTVAPLKIVTTSVTLLDLAKRVGGTEVEVVSLVRGNQDPHAVEPQSNFLSQLKR